MIPLRYWIYAIDDLTLSLTAVIPWKVFDLFLTVADPNPVDSIRRLTIYTGKTLQSINEFLHVFNPPLLKSLDTVCCEFEDANELRKLINKLVYPPVRDQIRRLSIVEDEKLVCDVEISEVPQCQDPPLLNPIGDWYYVYGYDLHDVCGPHFHEGLSRMSAIRYSAFTLLTMLSSLVSLTLSLPGLLSIIDGVLS
jgi:hypothetical protein